MTKLRYPTVCQQFNNFESLLATIELYHAADMNRDVTKQELNEIVSAQHVYNRQHFQVDETTWGAVKYGSRKGPH